MAVLQSHEWPGNVRQLRNMIERLMIMTCGDPDTLITASMLPEDIGSNVPLSPNGSGGEHLMSLPLRDAREIFEREYLMAQINRLAAIFRVRRSSSAWSARRCIGNCVRWA